MKIVAITACLNEDDIIEAWLRHMLAEEVDHIYIEDGGSIDDTRIIIESLALGTKQITLLDHSSKIFYQARRMTLLSDLAGSEGADWIIPADVDEFYYATNGDTVGSRLRDVELGVNKLYCKSYQHLDWDTRQVEPKRLPKVIYRYFPGASLTIGNHEVNLDGGVRDIIDLREIQYRGYEHFKSKIVSRLATLDPVAKSQGAAWHYQVLEGKNEQEMALAWADMTAIPTIHDPIPTHLALASSYLSTVTPI